jgi:hypothetical protein
MNFRGILTLSFCHTNTLIQAELSIIRIIPKTSKIELFMLHNIILATNHHPHLHHHSSFLVSCF